MKELTPQKSMVGGLFSGAGGEAEHTNTGAGLLVKVLLIKRKYQSNNNKSSKPKLYLITHIYGRVEMAVKH